MGLTIYFDTIYESHYTILTNIYIYLQYFQQQFFNFNKINDIQTYSKVFLFLLFMIICQVQFKWCCHLFVSVHVFLIII